jgi:hypothetical protein
MLLMFNKMSGTPQPRGEGLELLCQVAIGLSIDLLEAMVFSAVVAGLD